jgi:hypothetical protein
MNLINVEVEHRMDHRDLCVRGFLRLRGHHPHLSGSFLLQMSVLRSKKR